MYDSSKSSTYVKNAIPCNNFYVTNGGFLSTDTVTIAGLKINSQTFVEANLQFAVINSNGISIDGFFGLGLSTSAATPPLVNMVNQKLISQPVFAMWLIPT